VVVTLIPLPSWCKAVRIVQLSKDTLSTINKMRNNEIPNWMTDEDENNNNNGSATPPPPPRTKLGFSLPGLGGSSHSNTSSAAANGVSPAQGDTGSVNNVATDPDADKLPRIILMMRLANIGVAAVLMIVAFVIMAGLPSLSSWILAMYALCGALLICFLETQLKFLRVAIALNFGFLFSAPLRFFFYLLLAMIAYSFGIIGAIVGFAIVSVAFFNAYVLFRYPSYRAVRERIAEEEDRLIEAKVSREVKRTVANSLLSAT